MPWTTTNPPKVAKHWSDTEKRICTSAANSELKRSGDDKKAIFACIGAVKNHRKSYKQGPEEDEYDLLSENASELLQDLVALFYAGDILLDEFTTRFQDDLRQVYLRAMLLGRGDKEITEDDLVELQRRLDVQYAYLDDFVKDLRTGRYSEQKALWRAGLYGFPRGAFIYYSIPEDVAALMPFLPGDLCLGGPGLCKCHIEVSYDDEGTAFVDWVLDPVAEHCSPCIAASMESPFVFSARDLMGE